MAAFTLSVPVTFRYLDRSESFTRSLAGTDALLVRLRQVLIEDLTRRVNLLLTPTPSLVLTPNGEGYLETVTNPTGTEAYKQQLHEFVTNNALGLVAYYRALRARTGWTRWARIASWSSLALSAWEVVALCALAYLLRVRAISLPEVVLFGSFGPTVVAICGVILGLGLAARHHDVLIQLRADHEPL